jgi:hypothetical protein
MTFKLRDLLAFARVAWHMTVQRPDLRRHFWVMLIDCVRHNPGAVEQVIYLMALYLHLGRFSLYVVGELNSLRTRIDKGELNVPPSIIPLPAVG